MSIVDRIRMLSKQKGLSITELEKVLGLGNGTIGKWNKQSPSCNKVKLVANFFSVSIDYLVNGVENNLSINNGDEVDIVQNNNISIGETSEELLRVFQKLPIKERIKLMNIVYAYEDEYFKKES